METFAMVFDNDHGTLITGMLLQLICERIHPPSPRKPFPLCLHTTEAEYRNEVDEMYRILGGKGICTLRPL